MREPMWRFGLLTVLLLLARPSFALTDAETAAVKKAEAAAPAPSKQEELLTEIRDLLKQRSI